MISQVLTDGSSAELTSPVSGIVLLLLTALRQTYRVETTETRRDETDKNGVAKNSSHYVPVLDATLGSADSRMWKSGSGSIAVYPTALQVVLKGIVTWISSTSKKNSGLYWI